MCRFSWFLKQYCMIAPTVLASVYVLLLQKHKIMNMKQISYYGLLCKGWIFFCWTVSVVCGTTAGAAVSKISNEPVTFESNRNRLIRIESRSFAGPYFQHALCRCMLPVAARPFPKTPDLHRCQRSGMMCRSVLTVYSIYNPWLKSFFPAFNDKNEKPSSEMFCGLNGREFVIRCFHSYFC